MTSGFLLTPNPRALAVSRQAYLEASAMRLAPARPRPASAPALRAQAAQAVPVTPLQLLRERGQKRPSSAWAPKEAPTALEAPPPESPAQSVPSGAGASRCKDPPATESVAPSADVRASESCAEASQSSATVSTQQPPHSETSQELDVPEEDCDEANEAELQGKVEALRARKDLHEKLMKLQQQRKDLEEEQQEVQKLLQTHVARQSSSKRRPRSAVSRSSAGAPSPCELRIDGKAISGGTSRRTPTSSTRPSSSPGALRRSASAPGRGANLKDVHYETMRRQAAQRLELLKQREVQREPWTHGGSRPSRPWSAIPGYTGYRPHMEEDSLVGCNWSRASLQCIRLFGKPGR